MYDVHNQLARKFAINARAAAGNRRALSQSATTASVSSEAPARERRH